MVHGIAMVQLPDVFVVFQGEWDPQEAQLPLDAPIVPFVPCSSPPAVNEEYQREEVQVQAQEQKETAEVGLEEKVDEAVAAAVAAPEPTLTRSGSVGMDEIDDL